MTIKSRGTTQGNTHTDFTKVRKDLKDLPAFARSTMRNAVPRNGVTPDIGDIAGTPTVNPYKLQRLSDVISNHINAVVDLRAITPYIDKAELIWNTILLYPNGQQNKILSYSTIPSKYKNTELHTGLLKIWEEYFTNNYKIEGDLKKIVNDILWNTGSYCLFNLSRGGLDYLINGSEIDPRTGVAGNESASFAEYRSKAIKALAEEYTLVDRKARLKGFGLIRDPNIKLSTRSGLEEILGGNINENGVEFNLFGKDVDPDNLFNITFTDNPSCLYQSRIKSNDRLSKVNSVTGAEDLDFIIDTSMKKSKDDKDTPRDPIDENKDDKKRKKNKGSESTTQNFTDSDIARLSKEIYQSRNIRTQSMQFVKTLDSLSVPVYGRGLTWHVPSEAVIPIHYNGQNNGKGDFIFLLDPEDGTFLKNTMDPEFYQSVGGTKGGVANKPKSGSTDSLISSLRTIQEGKECEFDMSEFAALAEASLIKQWTSSILSDKAENISITLDEETNKIWLSRLFRKQGVRCLFVPGEAVTYMALKYSRLGIGQSLTQLAKMHIARLAAYDVADSLANLERAQPHTMMTVIHGANDGDPENTAAIAKAAFFATNPKLHSLMSTGQLSIPLIVNSLRDSSLTVRVQAGENPLVATPEITMDRMEKNFFQPVDDASRNKVLNDISSYFFTPRSWLDIQDEGNDFKIEAVTEHEMVSNQAANWQNSLATQLMDFMRKHIRVNGPMLTELSGFIAENKKLWKPDTGNSIEGDDSVVIKTLLVDFMTSVYCSFPERATIETTDKLKNQLDAVEQLVDKWMEIASSSALLKGIATSLGLDAEETGADEIIMHVKAYFYFKAFKQYNLPMPFDDIVNDGEGGGIASLVQGIIGQNANVQDFYVEYLLAKEEQKQKFIKKNQKKLEKFLPPPEPVDGGLDAGGDNLDNLDNLGEGNEDDPLATEEVVPEETDPLAEPATGEEEEEEEKPEEVESEPATEPEPESTGKGSNDPSSPDYNPFGKK